MAGHSPASLVDSWGVEPPESWGTRYDGSPGTITTHPVPTEPGRWSEFYPAFARAVRQLGPVPVDPRDAVATARVLDAAKVSADTGTVTTLG